MPKNFFGAGSGITCAAGGTNNTTTAGSNELNVR